MSFYGNLSNNSRFQLYFDKVYNNRVEMEKNKDDDGVFVGRYVLIEYGANTSKDSYLLVSALASTGNQGEYYAFMSTDTSSDATKVLFKNEDLDSTDLEELRSLVTLKKALCDSYLTTINRLDKEIADYELVYEKQLTTIQEQQDKYNQMLADGIGLDPSLEELVSIYEDAVEKIEKYTAALEAADALIESLEAVPNPSSDLLASLESAKLTKSEAELELAAAQEIKAQYENSVADAVELKESIASQEGLANDYLGIINTDKENKERYEGLLKDALTDYLVALNTYNSYMNDSLTVGLNDMIYYVDYSANEDKFYTCKGHDDMGYAIFELAVGSVDNQYLLNYNIDKRTYSGSCYDSTVWRKSCEDGVIQYTMIAELNTTIPQIELTVDAPTINPIPPHFGTDGSNVDYKLHVQPTWGLRVKAATANQDESDGEESLSDETATWVYSKYNENTGLMSTAETVVDSAIYYNRDGFDIEKSNHSDIENKISCAPTGKSGTLYNVHTGDMDNENRDIFEMSFILPAVGNAVATVYDTLYGVNEETQIRYRDIEWKDVLDSTRETGKAKLGYATRNLETLAGCINSVHDLMGMIIHETDEDLTDEGVITDADMDKIYYQDGKYYRKHETFDYEEIEYDYAPIELNANSYSPSSYYYLVEGDGFYPATDSDFDENKSYYVKGFKGSFEPIGLLDYKPGEQYYKDSHDNYILDMSETATNERFYCTFTATPIEVQPYNADLYFIKSDTGYVRNSKSYDSEQEYFSIEEDLALTTIFYESKKYFYMTEDGKTVRDASETITEGRKYYTSLDNPTYDIDDTTGEVTPTGDVDESSAIELIGFEPDTYYVKTDDNTYTLLSSIEDYSAGITYYTLKVEKFEGTFFERLTFWYLQDGSYYLDNNESLDTEENREYFTISDVEEITTDFYIPGAYYYYNEFGELVVENASEQDSNKQYYDKVNYYVIRDDLGNFAYGSIWSETVNEIPASVSIGTRTSRYEMLELSGFADNLNTIHGLILLMNKLLDTDDSLTRDTSTVLGTLNRLNDILSDFALISPGEVLVSDMYNRINSVMPTADKWIAFDIKPYANRPEIKFRHLEPDVENVTTTKSGDEEPKFGGTFSIPEISYDEMGHVASSSSHTVKIPKLSLTDTKANGADVITQLSLDEETGAFTSTRSNIGTLLLTGYEKSAADASISATDTLNVGLGKVEGKLDRAIEDYKNIVDNLDYEDVDNTSQFVSKVVQVDGKIAVTRSNAGTLLLTGYTEAETADTILETDTINSAFGKVQKQLSILNAGSTQVGSVAYQIALIVNENNNGSIDTLNEIASWIVNDDTGAAKMASDINSLEESMGNAEDAITSLLEKVGTVETALENSKGDFESVEARFASAEDRIDLLEDNTYLDSTTEYEFDSYSKLDLISIIQDMAARITALENKDNSPEPEPDTDTDSETEEEVEETGN